MTDPYKCGRCGLPVSPGVCAPQPHVFHDRPEQCVPDLVAEVARLRSRVVKLEYALRAVRTRAMHECDMAGVEPSPRLRPIRGETTETRGVKDR